jgi:23S rRNA (pseudouridine1915-N3)-methyltransferase
MRITFLVVGKTNSSSIKAIEDDYLSRLNHYCKTEMKVVENNALKSTASIQAKEKEGEMILKRIDPTDFVVLLDERGKQYSSIEFSKQLQQIMLRSVKNICFVVGGAYGFSDAVYKRANTKISLSSMTFSHQIIRIIFLEQLYRAFSIINNTPYHHE